MANLALAAKNVSVALAIIMVVGAAALLIRPAAGRRDDALGLPSALALSTGALGLIIFFMAATGLVGQPGWVAVGALLALVLASAVGGFARNTGAGRPQPRERFAWRRMVPSIALIVSAVGCDILMSFDPVFRSDALWYHLTLPHYWVSLRGLRPHPTLGVAGYPLLVEMIYTVPAALGAPFAARLIHLAYAAGVVFFIRGYLAERLSGPSALAFAAAFFLFDSVNEIASWANTDLARAFYLVGAASLLGRYAETGARRNLAVGALLAGLAMSSHYMAMVFGNALLTLALVLVFVGSGRALRSAAGDLALFWFVSLLAFAPWLVKNLVHYGEPFYGLAGTNFRIPTLGILADFYLGNVFFAGFAMAAVWVLCSPRSGNSQRFLALYLLSYLVVGAFEMPPHLRFFFPVYAVGLMLVGRMAGPVLERRRWLEVALPAVLLIAFAAMTVYQARSHLFDRPVEFLRYNRPDAGRVVWHR